MQESSRNKVLYVGEECADGCCTTSCGPPLLLLPRLFVAAAEHPAKSWGVHGSCECKRCTLQQRLQWLFLRLTSRQSSDFTQCVCVLASFGFLFLLCGNVSVWHFLWRAVKSFHVTPHTHTHTHTKLSCLSQWSLCYHRCHQWCVHWA